MTGIISLAVTAALCAFCVSWVGRRIGLPVTRSTIVTTMVVFVIVALALWGQSLI